MQAIRIAQTTARWLSVLAADFGVPVPVLAAQLRTPNALGAEIARYIVREGRKDAEHLISMRRPLPPPSTPMSLRERVCAAHFDRMTEYLQELQDAEADAALEAMMSNE